MDFSISKLKKINRKLKKLDHIILKETGISCANHPTKHLVISNVGLVNGLSEEIIFHNFSIYGTIENICLLPGKSCCFLSFKDVNSASKAYNCCNGLLCLIEDKPIYLLFSEEVPLVECAKMYNELPPGLIILKEFISIEEEVRFLEICDFSDTTLDDMKNRKVAHFGYEFLYDINNIDKNCPLEQKIPKELDCLWEKFNSMNVLKAKFVPNQLTVNQYKPGQGIPQHIDTHSAFEDPIMSLSLQSSVVMEFKRGDKHLCILLPQRSLCIMSGESRYDWSHGITPRKFDIIKTSTGFNSIERSTRVSFTFRHVLNGDCTCSFKNNCDSYWHKNVLEETTALKLEKLHVHDVYEKISSHFSETRHKPWPQVQNFIDSFENGSVIIDVGCGNGKYLTETKNVFKLGCDTSYGLLDVCRQKKFQVLVANCLNIPLKNNSVDGAICIAVIHHLATEERRLKAIEEIVRILKVNGRGLIYVWAKDQEKCDGKTNYLKQNTKIVNSPEKETNILGLTLPVHTNRTQFKHNDVMVPWKTKNEMDGTYLRFYHVFEENELDILCNKIKGTKILRSYYDQGNWCIVICKIT